MSSYWQKRQEQLDKALEKDENALKKRLLKVYENEAAKLDREIAAYYQKYGKNNVVEYARLFEKLSDDDIKLLIERMDDFSSKYPEYSHLMPVRSSVYKLNRLEGLKESVLLHQYEIGAITNAQLSEHLDKLYFTNSKAAAKAVGLDENESVIRNFVNTSWSGNKNYSERIWQNADKLAQYLNNDISQGFARGDSYERLTQQVRGRFMNVAKNDAYRLIYTEGTYVMNESQAKVFEEDFEEYEYLTAGDGMVCSVCRALSGKHFSFNQREPGSNFPPMHPWCRCHFNPVVDDWDKWLDNYEQKHTENKHSDKIFNNFTDYDKSNNIKRHKEQGLNYIGKLDRNIYQCITDDITTDEVIVTDERILHIKSHHPGHFEIIEPYLQTAINSPDYILEDSNNSGLVLKRITENDLRIQIVLRLHTSADTAGFKNSLISAWKISESRWNNYIKNKKILYKSE